MKMLTIRPAQPEDTDLILRLVRELAVYEKAEHEVLATPELLGKTLFGQDAKVFGLICLDGDTPVGFAVYFFNYSTWQGRHGLYLEDLYVSSEQRGRGAGKALFKHLAKLAVDNDCGRFEWSVLDWNTPAIAFYEGLGAKAQTEWIRYRLTGAELEALASA